MAIKFRTHIKHLSSVLAVRGFSPDTLRLSTSGKLGLLVR